MMPPMNDAAAAEYARLRREMGPDDVIIAVGYVWGPTMERRPDEHGRYFAIARGVRPALEEMARRYRRPV